ncbi:NAD(P)-binding protein [Kocuria sp. JC486]|uniref:NAD(P)-binding protein n=1 Tax=Kocuria sp. JC486 TaxID=1970736 RepID=UPI0032AF4BCC
MPAAQRIGIVGTGMGGLTLATMLARAGIAVDILEQASGPSALGSGLTLRAMPCACCANSMCSTNCWNTATRSTISRCGHRGRTRRSWW